MTWCFNCLYCISPLLILLWVYIDRSERFGEKGRSHRRKERNGNLSRMAASPDCHCCTAFDWRKKNGHKNIFAWNWILMAYLLLWNCPDHYKLLFFCHLLKCFTNWCHFNVLFMFLNFKMNFKKIIDISFNNDTLHWF